MIDRVVAGAVLKAAPLALALPALVAGLELIDTSASLDASSLAKLASRALANVGYLVPLLAVAIGVTSLRYRRVWLSLQLLGWTRRRLLASATGAGLALAAALAVAVFALPDGNPAPTRARPQQVDGGWVVPFDSGDALVAASDMKVHEHAKLAEGSVGSDASRHAFVGLISVLLLGFGPLFSGSGEWRADRARSSATVRFCLVGGGAAVVVALANLSIDAGAANPMAAYATACGLLAVWAGAASTISIKRGGPA